VDDVPLASTSVMNKKYRNKQREDITVNWTSHRVHANATQITSLKGDAIGTYPKTDSGIYTKTKGGTTVTVKPPVTIRKEQSTSRRVLRAVSQTAGHEEETMGTDPDQDDFLGRYHITFMSCHSVSHFFSQRSHIFNVLTL